MDPNRFHCEDLLGVFKYRQSKTHLAKKLKTAPTTTKRLLQYVMKGAEDIAKMIGGEDMMVIYSSLLVSKPGGANQAFHEDVHEEHASGQTVYAMIVSLSDHTSVDVDLGRGKEISVAIPSGYAMIFDAKDLTYRGVGYDNWNLRIYLKFGVQKLLNTVSGESEVVAWETCPGCGDRIRVQLKTNGEKCVPYNMNVLNYTEEDSIQRVEWNRLNRARKYKTKDKKRKIENEKIKQENAKKISNIL